MRVAFLRVLQAKQQQLIQERRKQDEEKLLSALATPMGYHKGKPLAALVVFRACLQWRAFQADRTSVFDRIIQVQTELPWLVDVHVLWLDVCGIGMICAKTTCGLSGQLSMHMKGIHSGCQLHCAMAPFVLVCWQQQKAMIAHHPLSATARELHAECADVTHTFLTDCVRWLLLCLLCRSLAAR
jgi:hypothetical protein